jgi:hypothetical protein
MRIRRGGGKQRRRKSVTLGLDLPEKAAGHTSTATAGTISYYGNVMFTQNPHLRNYPLLVHSSLSRCASARA